MKKDDVDGGGAMKPVHSLLLLSLSTCCYSVSFVCSAVGTVINTGLFKSRDEIKRELSKYSTDPDALNAALKMRDCIATMSLLDKLALLTLLGEIMLSC
nr:secretoglobin family 1D member 1 [Pogona vitticeps]